MKMRFISTLLFGLGALAFAPSISHAGIYSGPAFAPSSTHQSQVFRIQGGVATPDSKPSSKKAPGKGKPDSRGAPGAAVPGPGRYSGPGPGRRYVGPGRPGPYYRAWGHRPYYGRIVGGVALGTIIGVTAIGLIPPRPAPDLCWYWADPYRSRGYWDYCD